MPEPDNLGDPLGKSFTVQSQQNALDHIEVGCSTTGHDAVRSQVSAESKWYQRTFASSCVGQVARSNACSGGPSVVSKQILQFCHQLGSVTILNGEYLDQGINARSFVELSYKFSNQCHARCWCTHNHRIGIRVCCDDCTRQNSRINHLLLISIHCDDGQGG